MDITRFTVPPGKSFSLKDADPAWTDAKKNKQQAAAQLQRRVARLAELQEILYAQNEYALLVIFQAMDAAGKDSAISHVLSGINPEGFQVYSFKEPSREELDHDYLWRCMKALPERGRIGVFNRSYYEEVLIVRVHPEILAREKMPKALIKKEIWKERYEDINAVERYLTRNGTAIVKFFLHVSSEEQRDRFLDRIELADKHWKFSLGDINERTRWGEYMHAYEEMLEHTSTEWAPWYVIPADHKWFTHLAIADILVKRLEDLKLAYPPMTEVRKKELEEGKAELEKEKGEGEKKKSKKKYQDNQDRKIAK